MTASALDMRLSVWLKGADLAATTAFLTLTDKMGYGGRLLALRRFDHYGFGAEAHEPRAAVARLKTILSGQSTFYNRIKHSYFLEFRWQGGSVTDGIPIDELERRLASDVARRLELEVSQDLNGKGDQKRVIVKNVPIYRTEVRVEALDPSERDGLARKLGSELSSPVVGSALGVCWYFAIRAENEEAAQAMTREIVVSRRRDCGLLLNPNYQTYQVLSVTRMH
jgi:hypothetical protein